MAVAVLDMPTQAAPADESAALAALLGAGARRLVLAGQPRAALPQAARAEAAMLPVYRPKEVLLALAAAQAEARSIAVLRSNPHFMPIADWDAELAVAHFCALELTCPVPRVHNALVLDGEDLLTLAEERRSEDQFGLHRRRSLLMDALLLAAPPARIGNLLPPARLMPAPVGALVQAMPRLVAGPAGRASAAGPVQWLGCDLHTGHYNFLELRRQPKLGTSHARVLLNPAARGGAKALVGFATPATLGELGPALRAFAALQGDAVGGPMFFVFFFGSPEDFAAALGAASNALFFGDNFRCPSIRFLFAPFAAPDLLEAIRGAVATVDTSYGGVLDALAQALGVPHRLVLGPDGGFDAAATAAAGPKVQGLDWEAVLAPAMLARRRQKANRSQERALVEVLGSIV